MDFCEVQWRWLWSRRVDPTSPEPPYVGRFEAKELWPEQAERMKAKEKNWMRESEWEEAMDRLEQQKSEDSQVSQIIDMRGLPKSRERHWKGNAVEEQEHIDVLVQQAEEAYQRAKKEKELERKSQGGEEEGEGEGVANEGDGSASPNDEMNRPISQSKESRTPLRTPPVTPASSGILRGMANTFLRDRRARDGWKSSKPIPYDPRVDRQTGSCCTSKLFCNPFV